MVLKIGSDRTVEPVQPSTGDEDDSDYILKLPYQKPPENRQTGQFLDAMDESISQNVAGEAAAPGSNDAANPPASNESQSQTSPNVRGKTDPA
ncbi:hypothetical protein PIB30_089424 [Stylosanthes scabra]|uniref:Uncharacterized protein n=1 Tax=Stylosanthes scabra TaxID=79078 RepID=A0ABU6TVZ7_9FABA|nr:hypothetical protein [Stylosanthes scabra]